MQERCNRLELLVGRVDFKADKEDGKLGENHSSEEFHVIVRWNDFRPTVQGGGG